MFIIWGTKSRQEDGGVVGDWCDVCRGPNYHRLTHFFKVGHVYYIPLGKGEYVGTNRQCTRCGTTCACNRAAYIRPLTHQEAHGRGIEQILEATNPSLLEQLRKQRSFEYEIAQRIAQPAIPSIGSPSLPPNSGQADPRMLAALQILGTLDVRDKNVVQFREKLQKWDYLTMSEREVLLHEIDAFVTEDRKVNSAIHFMKMLPTPTPSWINYLGCFTGIVVLIIGFSSLPFLQSWLWGSLFFVFSIAVWFYTFIKASNKSVRVWVRKVLIPGARERDADLRYFVGLLARMKGSEAGYEEKIADMVRNVDLIADELIKLGHLTLEEDARPTVLLASPAQTDVQNPSPAPAEESP